jgi:hypothetical protein
MLTLQCSRLRQKIWGYVLGNQLIHIGMQYRESSYEEFGYQDAERRLFNTICKCWSDPFPISIP